MRACQVRARLPWFLEALPSEQCAKGGAGGYTDALQRDRGDPSGIAGLAGGVVAASAFRTSYVPLGSQADFIGGMQVCSWAACVQLHVYVPGWDGIKASELGWGWHAFLPPACRSARSARRPAAATACRCAHSGPHELSASSCDSAYLWFTSHLGHLGHAFTPLACPMACRLTSLAARRCVPAQLVCTCMRV